jgi:hypothetical protein
MILLGGFMLWVGVNIFAFAMSSRVNRIPTFLALNGICLATVGLVVFLNALSGQ